jgi:hypothetical protein
LDALELAGVQLVNDEGGWLHPEYVRSDGKEYTDDEIAADVIGFNIHRRHLTKQEQVDLIDKALKATNTDSAMMARSATRDKETGQLHGSTKDEHKAVVVEQAAKVGISKRTVERVLSQSEAPPKKRRAKQPSHDPVPTDPAFTGPVSQTQLSGGALKTIAEWALECNLAQIHLRLARDGLRLAKEREPLKRKIAAARAARKERAYHK